MEELGELFKKMDTSNDGFLSMEELSEGLQQSMGGFHYSNEEWVEIIKGLDSNRDGQIDFQEFLSAAYDRKNLVTSEKLKIAFKLLDADNSGGITKDELKACFSGGNKEQPLMKRFDEIWSKILEEADSNHDGEIDFSEF